MIWGALLAVFMLIMMKIPVGKTHVEAKDLYANGTKEQYVLDNGWRFASLDDCMEYRELRQSGWKGDIYDYYEWKYTE